MDTKIYAEVSNGVLVQIIYPHPDGYPIEERFPIAFVETLIEITDVIPAPELGWIWDGANFSSPPPPYIDPRPALLAELDQIDRASARPLRVLIISDPNVGLGTPEREELEALELRAADLRAQLEALPPPP